MAARVQSAPPDLSAESLILAEAHSEATVEALGRNRHSNGMTLREIIGQQPNILYTWRNSRARIPEACKRRLYACMMLGLIFGLSHALVYRQPA